MAFEDQVEIRLIKAESRLTALENKPIVFDNSATVAKLAQDIIHLKEVVAAQQLAIASHGEQIFKKNPFKFW